MLRLALLSPVIFLFVGAANAADTEWNWVWTTPDHIGGGRTPNWTSESGTAKVVFRGKGFSAHLENSNADPAYDLLGQITDHTVIATAKPTDSDGLARHCDGHMVTRDTVERIALLCDDGEFIGLDRLQP